jgi:hypothetical protein
MGEGEGAPVGRTLEAADITRWWEIIDREPAEGDLSTHYTRHFCHYQVCLTRSRPAAIGAPSIGQLSNRSALWRSPV